MSSSVQYLYLGCSQTHAYSKKVSNEFITREWPGNGMLLFLSLLSFVFTARTDWAVDTMDLFMVYGTLVCKESNTQLMLAAVVELEL